MSKFLFEERAWQEYLSWQAQDRKTLKRINALLKDIAQASFEGMGKPEPLKNELNGYWSRRIDEKNRIAYKEKEETIIIIACKGHYEDN